MEPLVSPQRVAEGLSVNGVAVPVDSTIVGSLR